MRSRTMLRISGMTGALLWTMLRISGMTVLVTKGAAHFWGNGADYNQRHPRARGDLIKLL